MARDYAELHPTLSCRIHMRLLLPSSLLREGSNRALHLQKSVPNQIASESKPLNVSPHDIQISPHQ